MPSRVVVSAFEPFGHHATNPTRDALLSLRARGDLPSSTETIVLPVTFDGAGTVLLARLARERPSACVMFGLAGESDHIRIERFAYNETNSPTPDNAGVLRTAGEVIRGGPSRLEARGAIEPIVAALTTIGAQVQVSEDPGRFVCNTTYYRVLANTKIAQVFFVHVPPTRALGGSIEPATLALWMRAAIAAIAAIETPIT